MFTLKNSFSIVATTLGLGVLATLAIASFQSSTVQTPSAKAGCVCGSCCDNGGCCCDGGACECKDCTCECCAAGKTTKSACCEKPASGRAVSAKAGCACGSCCDNGSCCCDGGACGCKECTCECCAASNTTKSACCEGDAACSKDAVVPKSACCASNG